MARAKIPGESLRATAYCAYGPFRLVQRADTGSYQIVGTAEGKRYRINCGPDLKYAKRQFAAFVAETESGLKPRARRSDVDWQMIAEATHRRQKNAAKGRGIPYELTAGMVYQMMAETSFRCSVSGIAFSKPEVEKIEIDPWAPSIDRIDNREGYAPGNVRVVAMAANYAMNRWGYDMLLRLAHGVVRSSKATAFEPVVAVSSRCHATLPPSEDRPLPNLIVVPFQGVVA